VTIGHEAVFTMELESLSFWFASPPARNPCAATPDERAHADQHAHCRQPRKVAAPSLWLWVLSASVCIFMQTLEVLTPASRSDRGLSIPHDMTSMRSCDFPRFDAVEPCRPAAPAALNQSWLTPAACGNRYALRRDDSVAQRRACWRHSSLLELGPQSHLTFRFTAGALGNLLTTLMMD
jgi:hypothetical protein